MKKCYLKLRKFATKRFSRTRKRKTKSGKSSTLLLVGAVLVLFYLVMLIKSAWIAEDMFITFRTIDNFVDGYGLRWNIAERVQSFTHPLWLFVLTIPYFFTNEVVLTTTFVCMAASLFAVILFAKNIPTSWKGLVVGMLMLCLSKAFIDYSTSGLENPLNHLLLVAFYSLFLVKNKLDVKTFIFLNLFAALGVLNRMDTLLLYFPVLVYAFVLMWKKKGLFKSLIYAFIGFLPFIGWEVFSLIYYGFPFPNTAYAKLSTGLPSIDLIQQGLIYLVNSISLDPITLFIIGAGIIAAVNSKDKKLLLISLAAVLYIIYTVKVGGDFMSGRFLAAPFLLSVIVLSRCVKDDYKVFSILTGIVLALTFVSPLSPLYAHEGYAVEKNELGYSAIPMTGIVDERGYFYEGVGLLRVARGRSMPDYDWVGEGEATKDTDFKVYLRGAVGMFGYYARRDIHIVDYYALTDPLLARLPISGDPYWGIDGVSNWRIGHFYRSIPVGYLGYLAGREDKFLDRDMAEYYKKLEIITRGPLFSLSRFTHIFNMNTGKYDHLLDTYISDSEQVDMFDIKRGDW
ncbi:hypothetical protein HOG48_03180 [Candidatus Peregrinibacteria bacterium]|jgi:arabinofuranosyltransferase|nr:hypothetical protein [Candidatus Peregrinibacteria bacterium]